MLSQKGSDVEELLLNTVVIKNSLSFGVDKVVGIGDIEADVGFLLLGFIDKVYDGVLDIETRVGGKGLGDDEHSFSKGFNTELDFALNFILVLLKGVVAVNFEGASSWDIALIIISVLNSSQTVSDGILNSKKIC